MQARTHPSFDIVNVVNSQVKFLYDIMITHMYIPFLKLYFTVTSSVLIHVSMFTHLIFTYILYIHTSTTERMLYLEQVKLKKISCCTIFIYVSVLSSPFNHVTYMTPLLVSCVHAIRYIYRYICSCNQIYIPMQSYIVHEFVPYVAHAFGPRSHRCGPLLEKYTISLMN